MSQRDQAYWMDCWDAFYLAHGMGKFEEVLTLFRKRYPEFEKYCESKSVEDATRKTQQHFIASLKAKFAVSDHDEHVEPPPTPVHIRQQFLPLLGDHPIPVFSRSVIAFNGQGRLTTEDASLQLHERHHVDDKKHHASGFKYRKTQADLMKKLIKRAKKELPHIAHVELLPLREVIRHLEAARVKRETDDVAASDRPSVSI